MTTKRRGYRKVHLGTSVWEYKFGKQRVVIYSPSGTKTVVYYSTMIGQGWDDDRDCRTPVGPGHVSDYIWANLWMNEQSKRL